MSCMTGALQHSYASHSQNTTSIPARIQVVLKPKNNQHSANSPASVAIANKHSKVFTITFLTISSIF